MRSPTPMAAQYRPRPRKPWRSQSVCLGAAVCLLGPRSVPRRWPSGARSACPTVRPCCWHERDASWPASERLGTSRGRRRPPRNAPEDGGVAAGPRCAHQQSTRGEHPDRSEIPPRVEGASSSCVNAPNSSGRRARRVRCPAPAMDGPGDTNVKARLRRAPSHPRAMRGCSRRSRCGRGRRSVLRSLSATRTMGPTRASIAKRSATAAGRSTPSTGSPASDGTATRVVVTISTPTVLPVRGTARRVPESTRLQGFFTSSSRRRSMTVVSSAFAIFTSVSMVRFSPRSHLFTYWTLTSIRSASAASVRDSSRRRSRIRRATRFFNRSGFSGTRRTSSTSLVPRYQPKG